MTEVYRSASEIATRVSELGRELGEEPVMLVGVLRGCVMFLADLARAKPGECEIAFVRARSYGDGTESSGTVAIDAAGPEVFAGRDVIIVDTILDTGHTLAAVIAYLESKNAGNIRSCVLLDKACRREANVFADFVGWTVPDEFLVGYGLDHAGRFRGLKELAVL